MCVYIYVYMHVYVVQLVQFVRLHVDARRRAHACVGHLPTHICMSHLYNIWILYVCVYIYVYMHVYVVQLVRFVRLHVDARRRAHACVGHLSIYVYMSCLYNIWILYICTYIYVHVYAYICSPIGAVCAPPRRCPPACACTRRTPFYTYMYESFI